MPPTLEDFYAWYHEQLAGETPREGDTARELAGLLFNSPFTQGQLDALLTAGLLPERWREAYGLAWGAGHQHAWKLLKGTMRRAIHLTPPKLRYVTARHQAQMRLALARGERPTVMARLLNTLDSYVDVPFSIRPVAVKAPATTRIEVWKRRESNPPPEASGESIPERSRAVFVGTPAAYAPLPHAELR
ncbi:oxygenase MpaB family protein [Archangium violaceum]|uniref:oxygenase MpaB family protein n=1 Tax=Archangium violaceum TaxID=83451 RepID=UPI002B2E61C2|nr:oxygenase MpaB family protein [Archangium gephyra]